MTKFALACFRCRRRDGAVGGEHDTINILGAARRDAQSGNVERHPCRVAKQRITITTATLPMRVIDVFRCQIGLDVGRQHIVVADDIIGTAGDAASSELLTHIGCANEYLLAVVGREYKGATTPCVVSPRSCARACAMTILPHTA